MAIKGVIYSNQKVSAAEHAALFRMLISDGILTGCGISYRYNNITISSGSFIVAGRLTEIVGSESIELENIPAASGYIRLRGVIDTNMAATKTQFSQFRFEYDYSSTSDGFDALTQEDVNNDGKIYEVEFAVLSIDSTGSITGLVRQMDGSFSGGGGGGGGGSSTPGLITSANSSFTGDANDITYYDDGTNWEIVFKGDGAFTFLEDPGLIDVFAVGGGQKGQGIESVWLGSEIAGSGARKQIGGKGGKGGQCITTLGISATRNNPYPIVIGQGGGTVANDGGKGGNTSGFGVTAKGGGQSGWSGNDGGAGAIAVYAKGDDRIGGTIAATNGTPGEYSFNNTGNASGSQVLPANIKYGASGGGGAARSVHPNIADNTAYIGGAYGGAISGNYDSDTSSYGSGVDYGYIGNELVWIRDNAANPAIHVDGYVSRGQGGGGAGNNNGVTVAAGNGSDGAIIIRNHR